MLIRATRINSFISQVCALARLVVYGPVDRFEVLEQVFSRGLHYFGLMDETRMMSIEDHAPFRLSKSLDFQSWQDWMLLELEHRGL